MMYLAESEFVYQLFPNTRLFGHHQPQIDNNRHMLLCCSETLEAHVEYNDGNGSEGIVVLDQRRRLVGNQIHNT